MALTTFLSTPIISEKIPDCLQKLGKNPSQIRPSYLDPQTQAQTVSVTLLLTTRFQPHQTQLPQQLKKTIFQSMCKLVLGIPKIYISHPFYDSITTALIC